MCDPSAAVIAQAQLSAAPPRRTTRLVLDLSYTSADAAAVARDLAGGILTQIETLLADPAADLSAELRGALAALAGALTEQTVDRATVTTLTRPLTRARRAHPAGWGR